MQVKCDSADYTDSAEFQYC